MLIPKFTLGSTVIFIKNGIYNYISSVYQNTNIKIFVLRFEQNDSFYGDLDNLNFICQLKIFDVQKMKRLACQLCAIDGFQTMTRSLRTWSPRRLRLQVSKVIIRSLGFLK